MRECAVRIVGDSTLIGVVTEPDRASKRQDIVVLLLNAGLLHRVGPNRLNVDISRDLAARGFLSCRFDFSGLGDSEPSTGGGTFQRASYSETGRVMEHFAQRFGVERFLLVAICSGADVALELAARDPRVVGAALINGNLARGAELDAALESSRAANIVRHYRARMMSPNAWLRLIRGRTDVHRRLWWATKRRWKQGWFTRKERAVSESAKTTSAASEIRAAVARGASLLVLYGDGSPTLDVFESCCRRSVESPLLRGRLRLHVMKRTDHTFTLVSMQRELRKLVEDWATNAVVEARAEASCRLEGS